MVTSRSLRKTLESDQPALGAWMQMPNPIAAEALGKAGFDWVGIDTQHGMIGYEAMLSMLQAIAISGTPSIVRVSTNNAAEIGRALDSGAQGVIVPLVETAAEAARAVEAFRYPPGGRRSWGAIRPALDHSPYTQEIGNDQAVCIPMVETVGAVERIEEIVAVEGVDAIHVGPSDLASSAGLTPMLELRDPEHLRLVRRIADACGEAGRWVGIHPPTPDVGMYVEMGFKVMPVYRDLPALQAGATSALDTATKSFGRVD
ncbi:MAG: 2,4-dihydroxyhept-2-ene-1,7-dioic acid aldolase [Propionibacteriales bacterium]|nr:2,4-dihydroxyhept-2-ene-1,7-dioic acid aldolase [Propionibacteriales bacterium]